MLKVKLKENIRVFESDDSSFMIQGNEIEELPEKHFKSYSIKLFLFTGRLQAVEGSALFHYKDSKIYLDKDGLYGKEYGKYYTKDLEFNTIKFIALDEVPKYVYNKLNDIEETKEVIPAKVEVIPAKVEIIPAKVEIKTKEVPPVKAEVKIKKVRTKSK